MLTKTLRIHFENKFGIILQKSDLFVSFKYVLFFTIYYVTNGNIIKKRTYMHYILTHINRFFFLFVFKELYVRKLYLIYYY